MSHVVSLRDSSVDQDIARYVDEIVTADSLLRKWGDEGVQLIKEHLTAKADGM